MKSHITKTIAHFLDFICKKMSDLAPLLLAVCGNIRDKVILDLKEENDILKQHLHILKQQLQLSHYKIRTDDHYQVLVKSPEFGNGLPRIIAEGNLVRSYDGIARRDDLCSGLSEIPVDARIYLNFSLGAYYLHERSLTHGGMEALPFHLRGNYALFETNRRATTVFGEEGARMTFFKNDGADVFRVRVEIYTHMNSMMRV